MNEMNVDEVVIEMFTQYFKLQVDKNSIDLNAAINETYNVDSIGKIEFVVALEEKFNITFKDEDLSDSNLANVGSIINIVKKNVGND